VRAARAAETVWRRHYGRQKLDLRGSDTLLLIKSDRQTCKMNG
jgi:hypothetical protein